MDDRLSLWLLIVRLGIKIVVITWYCHEWDVHACCYIKVDSHFVICMVQLLFNLLLIHMLYFYFKSIYKIGN